MKLFRHHNFCGTTTFEEKEKCIIAEDAELDISGGIIIGKDVTIGKRAVLITHKHDYSAKERRRNSQVIRPVPLIIEDDVFIGREAMILAVNRIGKGAIIGARSLVTKDVPAYEIWAGNPARKIGQRK